MYDPRNRIYILMGKTNPDAPRHSQQSMILVPAGTPGVEILRPLRVLNDLHSPHGHGEVLLTDVRVPASNLLLGEGRGFEIAQGRLGPGRIHHCMRLIGCAQRALDIMCARVESRVAYGKKISEQSSIRQDIAKSRCDIEQGRLLTLWAADRLDREGNKVAKDAIAMIKIAIPQHVPDSGRPCHAGARRHGRVPGYSVAGNIFLCARNSTGRWPRRSAYVAAWKTDHPADPRRLIALTRGAPNVLGAPRLPLATDAAVGARRAAPHVP